jgi:hypothetical protein
MKNSTHTHTYSQSFSTNDVMARKNGDENEEKEEKYTRMK